MFSGHSFGIPEADYAKQADDNLLVMVQIESQSGVDNVEEIAQVPGLDVLFIGVFPKLRATVFLTLGRPL